MEYLIEIKKQRENAEYCGIVYSEQDFEQLLRNKGLEIKLTTENADVKSFESLIKLQEYLNSEIKLLYNDSIYSFIGLITELSFNDYDIKYIQINIKAISNIIKN